jgi:hypothetical protein
MVIAMKKACHTDDAGTVFERELTRGNLWQQGE